MLVTVYYLAWHISLAMKGNATKQQQAINMQFALVLTAYLTIYLKQHLDGEEFSTMFFFKPEGWSWHNIINSIDQWHYKKLARFMSSNKIY